MLSLKQRFPSSSKIYVLNSVPQERGLSVLFVFRIGVRYNMKINPMKPSSLIERKVRYATGYTSD